MLRHPFPANITDVWQTILKSDQPITFLEMGNPESNPSNLWWEESIAWHIREGHKEIAMARMQVGDIPVGFIGFCFRENITFSMEQLELIQALANQATLAIHLTQLANKAKLNAIWQEQEKAAQERATELAKTNEAIAQTLEALTTDPELDRFLGQILTCIIEQIGADDTHLFLYDAETHTLRSHLAVQNNVVYSGNAPGDPELFYQAIPADINSAWKIVINSPKPFTLDNNHPQAIEFLWPTTEEWHESQGHQSATCACMKIGEDPIGFIGFAFCDRATLSNEQLEFIQALTNQATLSIHLTRLAEQARTNALMDERTRLAREIHDTLAQAFTGISLQLEAAKGILRQRPELAQNYLNQARDLARQGLSEARRSVHALRSQALETASLSEALQKTLRDMTRGTSLKSQFYVMGEVRSLTEDLQLNLLRIGQEAITNALRHGHAQTITITLTFDAKQIQLYIMDDGIGFDTHTPSEISGFGLIGIRERTNRFGGQFLLTSQPEGGTSLTITIPLPNHGL